MYSEEHKATSLHGVSRREIEFITRYVPRGCFVRIERIGRPEFIAYDDAVKHIVEVVEEGTKPLIVVFGLGGCGKTTVLRQVYVELLERGWIPILIRPSLERKLSVVSIGGKYVVEMYLDFVRDSITLQTFIGIVYSLAKKLVKHIEKYVRKGDWDKFFEVVSRELGVRVSTEKHRSIVSKLKEFISDFGTQILLPSLNPLSSVITFIAFVVYDLIEYIVRRYRVETLLDIAKKLDIKLAILVDDAQDIIPDIFQAKLFSELRSVSLEELRNRLVVIASYRVAEAVDAFDKIVYGSLTDIIDRKEIRLSPDRVHSVYLPPITDRKVFREVLEVNWRDEYSKVCNLDRDLEKLGKASMWLPRIALMTIQMALNRGVLVSELIDSLYSKAVEMSGEYVEIYEGMSIEDLLEALHRDIGYIRSYVRAIYEDNVGVYGPVFTVLTLIPRPIDVDILVEFMEFLGYSRGLAQERISKLLRAREIVVLERIGENGRTVIALHDLWRQQLESLSLIEEQDEVLKSERDDVAKKLLMVLTRRCVDKHVRDLDVVLNAIALMNRVYNVMIRSRDVVDRYWIVRALIYWSNTVFRDYPKYFSDIYESFRSVFGGIDYDELRDYVVQTRGIDAWIEMVAEIIMTIGVAANIAYLIFEDIEVKRRVYRDIASVLNYVWSRSRSMDSLAIEMAYVHAEAHTAELAYYAELEDELRHRVEDIVSLIRRYSGVRSYLLIGELSQNLLPYMLIRVDGFKAGVEDALKFFEECTEAPHDRDLEIFLRVRGYSLSRWDKYRVDVLRRLYYVLGEYCLSMRDFDYAKSYLYRSWTVLWRYEPLSVVDMRIALVCWKRYAQLYIVEHGLKALSKSSSVVEYPYAVSHSERIVKSSSSVVRVYLDVWKWINRIGFEYSLALEHHDSLLSDTIILYALLRRHLPKPKELGFKADRSVWDLFWGSIDMVITQGTLSLFSEILGIDLALPLNEVRERFREVVERYRRRPLDIALKTMYYLMERNVDKAIEFLKEVEQDQNRCLVWLTQNLRLVLERHRESMDEEVVDWLTRLYFYVFTQSIL